jgi:hypothetical protein
MSTRIFLLSPASCTGKRARMLMRAGAAFPLAQRVRQPAGAPLGEVFSFVSGLYFRGKLVYARSFAAPPPGVAGVLVITPDRGLVVPETAVTVADLEAMAGVDIHLDNRAYRDPLTSSAALHAAALPADATVVLLGSVATAKYADVLGASYGDRLRFPAEFAGRGDMSRGGLMLRCVDERRELSYVRLGDAPRRGPRPPKLAPCRRRAQSGGGA